MKRSQPYKDLGETIQAEGRANTRARQELLWYSKKQNKAGVRGGKEENLEK